MRSAVYLIATLGLCACTPSVPDSGSGVGFQDYGSYLKSREAGAASAPATTAAPGAPLTPFSTEAASAAIDNADGRSKGWSQTASNTGGTPQAGYTAPVVADGARPRGNAPAGIVETTSEMDAVNGTSAATAGVSDEQDFQAVTKRETIESDKARIERNKAQYTIDQPAALPQRVGDSGPNIVQYALNATNPVGTQIYKRSSFGLTSVQRACAAFASPDLAQEAFLAAGGPDKDRKGLDPDGDGYACAWDPTPFRAALK